VSAICGNAYTIFRERRTGTWHASGLPELNQPTSNEPQADPAAVARQTESGRKFLDALGVDRRCVIFTLTPTVDTPYATSAAVAAALQVDFFAPQMPLKTVDGSHLDRASAERWSQAFFAAAGEKIRECYVPSARAS
jgi:hypothetical protein